MRAIQDYQRALPHDVETAGPIKVLQSAAKVNLVQPPSHTAQRLRGSQRNRGILMLKRPRQAQTNVSHSDPEAGIVKPMGGGMGKIGEIAVDHDAWTTALSRDAAQRGSGFCVTGANHHRQSAFGDTALLPSNRSHSVAQILDVVE